MTTTVEGLLDAATTSTDSFWQDVVALCRIESNSYDKPALDHCVEHVRQLAVRLLGEPDAFERVVHREHGDALVLGYSGTGRSHSTGQSQDTGHSQIAGPGKTAIVGHYDTVWPAGTLAGWPGPDREVDGRAVLSLPGIFDMKFGLVQGLYALKVLRDAGREHPEVVFVINGDEEIGSLASRPLIERVCADADATLVLEASAHGAVKTGRKGVGLVGVELTGVEAHAGLEPHRGASAVHALAEVIDQLVAIADPAAGTTVNVGTVSGGSGSNVVAGHASAKVDIRVPTAAEQTRVDSELDKITVGDDRVHLELHRSWNRPPMALDQTSRPLLDRVLAVAEGLGRRLEHTSVGGASDANFVAGLGRPVVCGLGAEGSGAHARHEHVLPEAAAFRIALVAGVLSGSVTR